MDDYFVTLGPPEPPPRPDPDAEPEKKLVVEQLDFSGLRQPPTVPGWLRVLSGLAAFIGLAAPLLVLFLFVMLGMAVLEFLDSLPW